MMSPLAAPLAAAGDIGPIVAAVAILIFGVFVALMGAYRIFYKRASADLAFVRTGQGGAKVVVDGGALVFGSFHAIKWINLETIRLQVSHNGRTGLTTLDNFRVDVDVEFYIHVQPIEEHILRASRSLGDKSLTPETVKQLAEPKLNSVLRAVASTMDFEVLFRKKTEFEEAVHEHAKGDLEKNGLTLEAVSIVHLDQTAKDAFDPNNKFDAVGLKRITEATENARKEKNAIQRDAELAIKEKDVATDIAVKAKIAENELKNNQIKQATEVQVRLQTVDAEKKKLHLDQDLQIAAAQQFKEVETQKAQQAAETQRFKFDQEQGVKSREIEKDRAVLEANIAKDLSVQQANIAKETTLIAKKREMQEAQIAMELAVERAKRDKEIGIIQKVREQEAAEAEKLATVAERERADQNVLTVQKTAEAERERQVAVLQQRAIAEQQQVEKQVLADAVAYETRKKAEAEALAAEQQAAAIERLAIAKQREAEALAEGQRKMFEARNQIAVNVLVQDVALKLIEQSPALVRELMKPAEKISDIKILNVSGMGTHNGANGEANGAAQGSIVGKVVSSLLEAGAAYPMFKELLKFANVDMDKQSAGEVAGRAVDALKAMAAKGAGSTPVVVTSAEVVEPASVATAPSAQKMPAAAAPKGKKA